MADYVAGLLRKATMTADRREKLVREEALVQAADRGQDQLRVVEAYLSTTEKLDLGAIKKILADEKMAETARAYSVNEIEHTYSTPTPRRRDRPDPTPPRMVGPAATLASMRSAERVATGSTDAARRAARLEEQLSAVRSQLSAARGQLSTTLGELDGVLDADLAVADAALGNLSDEVLARLSGKTARLHRECLLEEARRSAAAAPRPGPTECVVCLERPREIAFDPCGHLAACETCSRSLGQCPICRRDVEARRRIFSS